MTENEIIMIFALILLVLASATFSSIETAYSSSNRIRLKNFASDNNKKAQQVLDILDNFDKFLSTVLVGNNIVNITATTISTLLFTGFFGFSKGPTISTIVITLIVLIFGEISPKSIAKRIPEDLAMSTVGLVRFLMVVLTPLTIFFKAVRSLLDKIIKIKETDSDITDELMTMVEEAENEGDLESHESDLISAAIEFNDLDVRDILTPRVDLIAVDITMSLDKIEEVFRLNSFSRLPVYENSIDNIIGVIHEKDFYSLYHTNKGMIKNIIKSTLYTSLHVKISTLLRQLQSSKTHLAVVLDEYGGTAGIITMEDLIEEVMGNIMDEYDEDENDTITNVHKDEYLVEGYSDIEELEDIIQAGLPVDNYDTVSGFVIGELGRIPTETDVHTDASDFTYNGYKFSIVDIDEKVVSKVRVLKIEDTQTQDEE